MPDDLRLITRALHSSGVLAVVIDEAGRVANATIRKSFNADYDAVIVRSAQRWKYRPAMKDGVPVRYVKTIVLLP
jgi:TonB family protein